MKVIKISDILIWFAVGLVCCTALLFLGKEEMYIAVPLFSCVLIMGWATYGLWKKDGGAPVYDIGFICALATFIYSVAPLVNFWLGGLQFGHLSDLRLRLYSPSPEEMGIFHWRHVLYLGSFVASYVVFRKKVHIMVGKVQYPGKSLRNVVIFLFFVFWLYFLLLELITGFKFNVSYSPDEFLRNVDLWSMITLIVKQVSTKLFGVFLVAKLAILFMVIQKCNARRWRLILFLWIAYELLYTFQLKGARSELVFFLIGAALMYHRLIAPLSLRFLIPAGILFFLLFTFMGVYRGENSIADTISFISESEGGAFSVSDEFQSLLGTEYDVYRRIPQGRVPWNIYLNDIITVLPPQQLLPFEKVRASDWYLQIIGLSGTGIGLMWGVITQCIVGLDWIELFLRGFILGFILSKFHDWYIKRKERFLVNIAYIYLCIRVYYTFRDTTGSILSFVVWDLLPFYGLILVLKPLAESLGAKARFPKLRVGKYSRVASKFYKS